MYWYTDIGKFETHIREVPNAIYDGFIHYEIENPQIS